MSDKFMPKKPGFTIQLMSGYDYSISAGPYQRISSHCNAISEADFNNWWDKEIKLMFENAVEVFGDGNENSFLVHYETVAKQKPTHKALLINIEPIKEESAEDILRELVRWTEDKEDHSEPVVYEKAKAYLARKKDGK